ncbi:hypothetical protein ACFIJ5_10965 [Haloimpatiens sp. FM7330]|uniref:hypothetical protein n=1 Tax=Haloimpatiens sp. FM7330 TaxID=3298610 RepID=UPI003638E732
MSKESLQTHVKVLGVLYIIIGCMYVLTYAIIAGALTGVGAFIKEYNVPAMCTSLGSAIISIFMILGVPYIVEGIALLKNKSWSRILGFILGGISLIKFPIGTALGVYTIVILVQNNIKDVLKE